MANESYMFAVNQIAQILKKINQPVTVDELYEYSHVNVKNPKSLKNELRKILRLAVQMGLAVEHNNHYFAPSHTEDILPILKRFESSNSISDSNEFSSSSELSSSEESDITIFSESETLIGSDSDSQSEDAEPSTSDTVCRIMETQNGPIMDEME